MEFAPGEIYSADWDDDGSYRVVKVLVVDSDAVHVRVYKQRFSTRPSTVDPGSLTLGTIHDADGFGVGHLPLAREELMLWEPRLIATAQVEDDELDGYRMWAEEPDAGVFGPTRLRDRIRSWLRRD